MPCSDPSPINTANTLYHAFYFSTGYPKRRTGFQTQKHLPLRPAAFGTRPAAKGRKPVNPAGSGGGRGRPLPRPGHPRQPSRPHSASFRAPLPPTTGGRDASQPPAAFVRCQGSRKAAAERGGGEGGGGGESAAEGTRTLTRLRSARPGPLSSVAPARGRPRPPAPARLPLPAARTQVRC